MAIYKEETYTRAGRHHETMIWMNGTMLCKIWRQPRIYGVIFDKKSRGDFPLLTYEDKVAFEKTNKKK